jgi:hypothetical protein
MDYHTGMASIGEVGALYYPHLAWLAWSFTAVTPHTCFQLVAWAFVAPEDAAAEVLLRSGYEAAMRWMDRGGKAAPPAG